VTLPEPQLEPLPYHVQARDYLKTRERDLWNWFASARAQADYAEHLRLQLLKATYRLDAESHPELHLALDEAKARLQLDIPVTLYQGQNSPQANATLFYMPGEGHVVFAGPVLTLLSQDELKSVLGHELAHYHLWQWQGGDLHVADRLLQAVSADPRATESHEQTARRFQLYTEIYADRGSYCVTRDLNSVVAGLVKIETGLAQVNAAGYLKQAAEIFATSKVETEGLSHPETFIRARALALWSEQPDTAQAEISVMIEGAASLNDLDLMGQVRLEQTTRHVLEQLLQPAWFQTPSVIGHARLFFPDFTPGRASGNPQPPPDVGGYESAESRLQEYVCYLLLDFATTDPDLADLPLAAALELSRQLKLDARFEKLAAKELSMKVGDVRKLKEQAAELLARAEAPHE